MHRFFFLMQHSHPLKSYSLETNLTEAIFRHFQKATKKMREFQVFTTLTRKHIFVDKFKNQYVIFKPVRPQNSMLLLKCNG